MNHQEQTNQDKHPDESKTRTHRFSKLPDDGDPCAPNNVLTPEQKKNISWTPVGQAPAPTNYINTILCKRLLEFRIAFWWYETRNDCGIYRDFDDEGFK